MPVWCSNPQCDAGPKGRQAIAAQKFCGRCLNRPRGGSKWCRSKGCGQVVSATMDCQIEVCSARDLLEPGITSMYCPFHAAIVRADGRVPCLITATSKISAFSRQNRWIIFLRRCGRPQLVGKAIDAFLQRRGVQHLS